MSTGPDRTPEPVTTYAERMGVPVGAWLGVFGVWLAFCLAMGGTLGPWVGLPLLLVGGTALVAGLRSAAGRVEVTADALVVGRASLPLSDLGTARPLDAEAARILRGTGADGRAFIYLRSWVPTAVKVDVEDPTDPAPYWYVSTSRPADLVAALTQAKTLNT